MTQAASVGHGHGGGGHGHGGHGRGRRGYYGGWGGGYYDYGYPDGFLDPGDVLIENVVNIGIPGDPTMNSNDPWRAMESSPPAPYPVLPTVASAPGMSGTRGVYRHRSGVLADVAGALAPATGGVTFNLTLDPSQLLHAVICVDGKCYKGAVNVGPAIKIAMDKIAAYHQDLHAAGAPAETMVSGDLMLDTVEDTVSNAGELLVGALIEQHKTVALAGWFDSIKGAVNSIGHTASQIGTGVAHTLKALKVPISIAAAAAATSMIGPQAGPMAAQMTSSLIDAANGDQGAQAAVAEVQKVADNNPAVAKVLDTVKSSLAQTTAGYHVAKTASAAAAGDSTAQKQVQDLNTSAAQGDPAAQAAMKMASSLGLPPDITNLISAVSSGELTDLPSLIDGYRREALAAVLKARAQGEAAVYGVRRAGGKVSVLLFQDTDDAVAWPVIYSPSGVDYWAVFWPGVLDHAGARPFMEGTSAGPLTSTAVGRGGGRNSGGGGGAKRGMWLRDKGGNNAVFGDDGMDIEGGEEITVGTGGPRVEIIGADDALAGIRDQARQRVTNISARVIGLAYGTDGKWSGMSFETSDDADGWFGGVKASPATFVYAAYFDKDDPTWPMPLNEAVGHGKAPKAGTPVAVSGDEISRSYNGVTSHIVNVLLHRLADEGMSTTGNNPWDVETNSHGVRLHATWNRTTKVLTVSISDLGPIAGASDVWENVEPIMQEVLKG